jgi:predicted nucleic acid-binding protein
MAVADFDILIGATARHYGLTVVTHNKRHFERMPGVNVVDWVEDNI